MFTSFGKWHTSCAFFVTTRGMSRETRAIFRGIIQDLVSAILLQSGDEGFFNEGYLDEGYLSSRFVDGTTSTMRRRVREF